MTHLGLVAFILLFVLTFFILAKWDTKRDDTFSDHVARNPARTLFSIGGVLFSILYATWILQWTELKVFSTIIMMFALACVVLLSVVPRKDKLVVMHDVLATTGGIAFLVFILSLAFNPAFSDGVRWFAAVSSIVLSCFSLLLLNRNLPHYLWVQAAVTLSVHVTILTLFYVS